MQRPVCEIGSRLDWQKPTLEWLNRIERSARYHLDINPNRIGARQLREALKMVIYTRRCIEAGRADGAAFSALAALQAAWAAEIAEGRDMIDAGVKRFRAAEKANSGKSLQAEQIHADWQRKADAIRRRRPNLSKAEIARRIDPQRANYIRKRIT